MQIKLQNLIQIKANLKLNFLKIKHQLQQKISLNLQKMDFITVLSSIVLSQIL